MYYQLRKKSALPLAMSLLAVVAAGCGGVGRGNGSCRFR
jgi:hypothetical protein